MQKPLILQVALPIPAHNLFDYEWLSVNKPPPIGSRVTVLAKNRPCIGIVMGHAKTSSFTKLKPISKVIDNEAIIPIEIIKLCQWASEYYQKPLGEIIISVLPKFLRKGNLPEPTKEINYQLISAEYDVKGHKQKQVIELLAAHQQLSITEFSKYKINKTTLDSLVQKNIIKKLTSIKTSSSKRTLESPLSLNQEQQNAMQAILSGMGAFNTYLLHGVTGSGKTEVYMHCIQRVLDNNQQVLLLVPEIGLTPQIIDRLQRRFNTPIEIIHSNISETAKLNAWLAISQARSKILVGTRSALFTPMPNLGLIIIDEEHDTSYKQMERFRYHARDLAIVRAKNLNVPIILGSATPSLSSMYNAEQGKYKLITLNTRAGKYSLPEYHIIDMRNSSKEISSELIQNIKTTLDSKNQVLLFLNRRGFAPLVLCHSCGHSIKCQHCHSYFTYHKTSNVMICHVCTAKQTKPHQCPNCKLAKMGLIGIGTEKLAETLQRHFPGTIITRIDQDTTQRRHAMQEHLDIINTNKPMILIGTQMLAKGHHFPNVAMVGIIGIDNGLYSSDFHAQERIGQTITQVAGRAGRGNLPGKVFIQTHNPNHQMLQELITQNYSFVIKQLLQQRLSANLPPYTKHALFTGESTKAKQALNLLIAIADILKSVSTHIEILGPIPAIQEKRQGFFRYQLLLQSSKHQTLQNTLKLCLPKLSRIKSSKQTRWIIDVDPIDIL